MKETILWGHVRSPGPDFAPQNSFPEEPKMGAETVTVTKSQSKQSSRPSQVVHPVLQIFAGHAPSTVKCQFLVILALFGPEDPLGPCV